jgi:hypothetical protein
LHELFIAAEAKKKAAAEGKTNEHLSKKYDPVWEFLTNLFGH